MALPVPVTVEPMLARLVRELPRGRFRYEPKWDGFRCLAFRDGHDVELRSRNGRPLARYFPELVAGLGALPEPRFALDGEIVLVTAGEFDFAALMRRLHPAASLVERLAREHPAALVVFDVLAVGDDDLRDRPFAERRRRLERLLERAPPPLRITPQTDDPALAEDWLRRFTGGGIDGVVARPLDGRYTPGARTLFKVKHARTADCVVAGFRVHPDRDAVSSLLLGLYGPDGELHHVGVAASFTGARGRELLAELLPLAIPLERHPWRDGFLLGGGAVGRLKGSVGRWDPREMALDWAPIAPERVCEVAFEQVDERRFRHPARFRRWRPDRDPRSCTLDQLSIAPPDFAETLAPGSGVTNPSGSDAAGG
jgi:ATP-dependent DNA ligase